MGSQGELIDTSVLEVPDIVEQVNHAFKERYTQPIEWRKEQLRQVWRMLDENTDDILKALADDSGKLSIEAEVFDISSVKGDILHFLEKLDEWLAPETVDVPAPYQYWQPTIHKQPKGTVLIIAPWNYPIVLTLLPLVGAIAAGNTAIIKPSEIAPYSAQIITKLLPQYLDNLCFRVVNGGPEVVTALLQHPFGHIIYTGSTNIGKIVMTAAAKTLTPVTLELGGKSPVIVTAKANLPLAAKRIAWGKFWFAGQTCVVPDYLYVEESVAEELTKLLKANLEKNYGSDANPNLARLINSRHFSRVNSLITSTKGVITAGGKVKSTNLLIEPTLVTDVKPSDPLMSSEIFGPILPILTFKDLSNVPDLIASIDATPLSLYVFTDDNEEVTFIRTHTTSGGMSVNDVMGQMFVPSFAFGGFGTSGMGSYRGKASIDTFSHRKSVATVPTSEEFESVLEFRYADGDLQAKFEGFRKNLEGRLE